MDLFDLLLHSGLITTAFVAYLIFFKRSNSKGDHKLPGWNYPLKYLFAHVYAVRVWKSRMRKRPLSELPSEGKHEGWESISLHTVAPDKTAILLEIRKLCGRQPLAEVTVQVKLSDGTSYKLPQHPETAIGAWFSIQDGWSAGGLKIQILEPETRLRILYNGPLTRNDGVTVHTKMNLVWTSASDVIRFPEDWSTPLAARALALEPWSDGNWSSLLSKTKEESWHQWGAAQGRFETFAADGVVECSEYLRVRGFREQRWVPKAAALRRSLTLTVTAVEGTTVLLRAVNYKKTLTQYISGSVRFPDTTVKPITGTNIHLPDFFSLPQAVPKVFTINVSVAGRDLRLVVRQNRDLVNLFSGVPHSHETVVRALTADVDGEPATGLLEITLKPTESTQLAVSLSVPPALRWLSETEAGSVGYCLRFEDSAAGCPDYVGGKSASLALLASVQTAEGYRVPPGFCLTTKALNKHLEDNPELLEAIHEIEAANENYDENIFKSKCAKAAELIVAKEITKEVREDILTHLTELREKALSENLGSQLRFAVRSSAIGEDSEALSAAGQNDTFLGCVTDEDVLKGVQKCWGSMFAFTSAYYRRQNGQGCLCGGGVAVQALVSARAAGVMFTRDPRTGDRSRILLAANYGLGETVVSGSVEPDSFVVSRTLDDRLSLIKVEVGSKAQRVTTGEQNVTTEVVSEAERSVACLSEGEVLRLAQVGVAQEQLWGAGRDIEWAIYKNDIFLLQARPITSLERWSDEELLHELDTPVMADDELTTFANCGEVFPKPVTPLSYDLVLRPLTNGMKTIIDRNIGIYEDTVVVSHNRCMIALYNSVYRRVSREIDVGIRMLEMAIHGHKVAGETIIQTAIHRRPPHWKHKIEVISFLLWSLLTSKWSMTNTMKTVKESMRIETKTDNPNKILESIQSLINIMNKISANHAITSGASTSSQFIAMTVLLEGGADFTSEQCNEISALLSSGDVLSAEVPQGINKLARKIAQSEKAEEFRKQDPKEALPWLKENLPSVYAEVTKFLDHHGHRAIMEFDMYTKPWVLVPEELMKILQNLRLSKEETQVTKTDAEIIASLTTPKKSSTRKVLAWVLPLCRRTVRHREGTKAFLILGVHKLRLAAIEMGKLLVKQWYLPHEDLVFFFRAPELKKYIETRDPALLKKAMLRQQYYPRWSQLKFAELNTGWVRAQQPAADSVRACATLRGASVCGGDVTARACVVTNLSEINQLQQGDILITHATDIGWSPYFPLIAGIVTELGGLISHGAVIAREYGLPCIVGAANATDIFQTGDLVRLSGSRGVIEKVELSAPETDNKG